MNEARQSKADLHIHSKHSDRPSEWFLRRIGSPECFVEPIDVYRRCKQRGMDFVTISDHNCIAGALEIAHLPGAFISNEVTTYFPENGAKVHILVTGINEEQFRMIQELRADIYQFQEYVVAENIISSVAHPLFRVNHRLTIDQLERLILLFPRFEAINGARDRRAADLVAAIFHSLTPEMMHEMADRQGIEPFGREPWKKFYTAGSDDHSGVYAASAYTTTPAATSVDEFLAFLRRGDHEPAGSSGGSVQMGHGLYHIAYSYYKNRILHGTNNGKPTLVGELFKRLLESSSANPSAAFGWTFKGIAARVAMSRQLSKLTELERTLVDDFRKLFAGQELHDTVQPMMDDRRTFRIACHISQTLGYSFLTRFVDFVRQGQLMESLQTVASLAPVALSMAPYLAAFSTQHKDEAFHRALTAHFPAAAHLRRRSQQKAWITDTFAEVNGVSRTIRTMAATARKTGRGLTVLACLEKVPSTKADVKNFPPVGTFKLPEYESQKVSFPPFLEVIEYIERHRFNELIISTPGPMGLTGLAAARLLGLRTTGIYHTDFVEYVRQLTQDDDLAELTWKYLVWFYDQCHTILAPTDFYRKQLIHNGFDPTKVFVMPRGVDTEVFNPSKAQADFFDRLGLAGKFHFIYVGRISKEKNVENLLDAFDEVLQRGHNASLTFVGEGPIRNQLESRIQGRPIAFTGLLEGEELSRAYASADCMVFPSTTDTFGNVVLEAHASGVPVIVSDRGGPAEIVTKSGSGLVVNVSQPKNLADAMERMFLQPELRAEFRTRGLQNATGNTWEKVLDGFWSRDEQEAREFETEEFRASEALNTHGVIAMDVA
jgi:glycosyltransferase involved in cell wall biosynthesis/predicted metal-dependent phosphoesterase TrpH